MFLRDSHPATGQALTSMEQKNLVIAFVTQNELRNTSFGEETMEFINRMKIEKSEIDSIRCCFFIIALPDQKQRYYDRSLVFDSSIMMSLSNFSDKRERRSTSYQDIPEKPDCWLTVLKELIETGDYPISLIEIDRDEEEHGLEKATEYIRNFILISKYRPLKLSFQDILD